MKKVMLLSMLFALNLTVSNAQMALVPFQSASNELWGYMDVSGKVVIEPKYDGAFYFSDGFAHVFTKATKQWSMIDKTGATLSMPFKMWEPVNILGFDRKGFENGVLNVIVNKKIGAVDVTGKVIFEPSFDFISEFDKSGFAVAKQGTSFFILEKNGTKKQINGDVVEIKKFEEDLAPFRAADKNYGFINKAGEIVIPATYKSVGYFSQGLAWFKQLDGKCGFIDKTGKEVVAAKYLAAKEFTKEGFARVKNEANQWLFVGKDGKEMLVAGATNLGDFSEGLAWAEKGELHGYVNTKGEWVIDAKYLKVYDFSGGIAAVKSGETWGFIDNTGKTVHETTLIGIRSFQNGYAAASSTVEKWGLIDKTGKWVIPCEHRRLKDVDLVK